MHNTIAKGFRAAAVLAGIKKKTGKDLGLIYSEIPADAAAVFTRNRVLAAPVLVDKEKMKSGKCQAVIVNSGNANCCTGSQGIQDALSMCRATAQALGISEELVYAASTGVIGQPMPITKVLDAVPGLVEALRAEKTGGRDDFARAIMTTDLVPKVFSLPGEIRGKRFRITGIAKGSGMIRPDMATMLCFVCTDAEVPSRLLQESLSLAADGSFNRITVDGDTSTNDMVLLMANGMSGAKIGTEADREIFQSLLNDVLLSLAKMIVKDGEGASKMVEIIVQGAVSDADARKVADTIAHSSLVKTALFGEDANWGRILAAAGRAGVPIDPDRVDIRFNDVLMAENGMSCGDAAEAAATEILKMPEFAIVTDLKSGKGRASVFTCDFSVEYVRINADYRT